MMGEGLRVCVRVCVCWGGVGGQFFDIDIV